MNVICNERLLEITVLRDGLRFSTSFVTNLVIQFTIRLAFRLQDKSELRISKKNQAANSCLARNRM
jgi:ABC-type antimicrobial peptide transport system ATPase subunit